MKLSKSVLRITFYLPWAVITRSYEATDSFRDEAVTALAITSRIIGRDWKLRTCWCSLLLVFKMKGINSPGGQIPVCWIQRFCKSIVLQPHLLRYLLTVVGSPKMASRVHPWSSHPSGVPSQTSPGPVCVTQRLIQKGLHVTSKSKV